MNPSIVTKSAITLVSGLSALTVAAVATMAFAEPIETENRISPTVPFAQAMDVATGAAQGNMVSLEVQHSGETPVYIALLVSPTSHTELRIDGMTGEILGSSTISAASPEALHAMFAAQGHGEGRHGDDSGESHGEGAGRHGKGGEGQRDEIATAAEDQGSDG